MPISNHTKFHIGVPHHLPQGKLHISEHMALYLTQTLRIFAVSLIGVFLPIYIYINSHNYMIFHSNQTINGILWGFSYFFLRSFGVLVFTTLLGKLIFSRFHLNRSLFASLILQIFEIILWFHAKNNLYLMLLAGLLAGLKVTLYWIPYHVYFVKKFKGNSYGQRTSVRFVLEKLTSGITPFLGGLVISLFGFDVLFVFSIVLILAAGLPILLAVHEWKHRDHNLVDVYNNFIKNKKYRLMNIAYLAEGSEVTVYFIVWPILMFLGLTSFVKIGSVISIATVISVFTAIIAGRSMDKFGSKKIHAIGVFFNTLLYIPRVFIVKPIWLYVIDIADRINSPLYSLPNMALAYEKAKRSVSSSDYIIYREIMIHTGIVLTAGVLIFVLMQINVWRWVFLLTAFTSSLTYLMDIDRN